MKKIFGNLLYILLLCIAHIMLGVFYIGGLFSEKWKREYHIQKYKLTHM